ncbi:MAG: DUF3999 family protein [Pseudomonadota bacterium]
MKFAIILAIFLLSQPVSAGTLSSEDFVNGFELQLQGRGAIHRLPLPEKIYTTVVQPDIADIRVFNGEGNPVPHLLKREQVESPQIVREQDLPFSPLYDIVPTGTIHSIETQIKEGAEGAGTGVRSVDISRTVREKKEEDRQMNGYLLETADIATVPFRLQFTVNGESGFMTTMILEDSNDLVNWSFVSRETLARLDYHGHIIEKNGEELIDRKKKYIRISWPASEEKIIFDRIRAVSYSRQDSPDRNWTRLNPQLSGNQTSDGLIVVEFDSNGFLPIDTIRVGLSGGNNLIRAVLKSRAESADPWRLRGQGTFYKLQNEGLEVRNDIISLPLTTDRYWRLEIPAEGKDLSPDLLPYLELGWQPQMLYFLSQGDEPYILAFGSGRMASATRNSENGLDENVLKDIEKQQVIIQEARIGREIELGGPDMLIPLPPPPPWKKWLLWGIMIGGVMMIGAMAYSLYRQMRSSNTSG